MNRRAFFATLFAAPLAAVAALKAKALTQEDVSRITSGWPECNGMNYWRTQADTTHWSNASSTPLEDIERAMKKIREGVRYRPVFLAEAPHEPLAMWVDGHRLPKFEGWLVYDKDGEIAHGSFVE